MKLSYHIIRLIGKYFSPFLAPIDRRIAKRNSKGQNDFSSVYIIGLPRSGSTILYQVVTNMLNVKYIDNLSAFFYKNLQIGFYLSHLFFKSKPHNCFKSEEGETYKCGLHAPSESGEFWYRFLPRDPHFIDEGIVDQNDIAKIKMNFDAIKKRYSSPLVIKNLNAGLRLRLIKEIDNDAKFIYLKRNKVEVAMSILKARTKRYGSSNSWFSLKPPNYAQLKELNYIEQIVGQINSIEYQIENDLSLFHKSNILEIEYLDLCNDTKKTIDKIKTFIDVEYKCEDYWIHRKTQKQDLKEKLLFEQGFNSAKGEENNE